MTRQRTAAQSLGPAGPDAATGTPATGPDAREA
jgi:hypothetical protein